MRNVPSWGDSQTIPAKLPAGWEVRLPAERIKDRRRASNNRPASSRRDGGRGRAAAAGRDNGNNGRPVDPAAEEETGPRCAADTCCRSNRRCRPPGYASSSEPPCPTSPAPSRLRGAPPAQWLRAVVRQGTEERLPAVVRPVPAPLRGALAGPGLALPGLALRGLAPPQRSTPGTPAGFAAPVRTARYGSDISKPIRRWWSCCWEDTSMPRSRKRRPGRPSTASGRTDGRSRRRAIASISP
jgi:hypothetical protein